MEVDSLKSGDHAIVELVPLKPVVIETFKDFPLQGRFLLRDQGIVAVGIVKSVV